MNGDTLLLRQVNPQFLKDDKLTSQVFMPFPKDDGRLSVKECRKLAKQLRNFAAKRGCLHAPIGAT